ncbi:MAG: hypothetical protein ABJF88_09570 [Rhodothermales bacterium]
MNRFPRFLPAFAAALLLTFSACDSNEPDPIDGGGEAEVITLVRLSLTPQGGGAAFTADATFDEAGVLQNAEMLNLQAGTTYDVAIDLQNTTVTPPESITAEIRDEEPEAHRFFYVPEGDVANALAVSGLDTDPNGDPLGLTFSLAVSAGSEGESGTFRVKLRHYEEDANLPADKQNDTAAAPDVPGVVDTDVDVVFPVSIDD